MSEGALIQVKAAGVATVSESGIEIESAPDGITFEPLTDHSRLGELVDDFEKFAAHNAAEWKHGLLVHVPKGVVLEEPLYVRIISSADGSALFWRMLVIADRERPIGLAGIMGGADTEVTEATRRVILESAIFLGPTIRNTARRLGLRVQGEAAEMVAAVAGVAVQSAGRQRRRRIRARRRRPRR